MSTPIEEQTEAIFSTGDLHLAAVLSTLKFPILGIDIQIEGLKGGPKGYFRFDNTDKLRDARMKYMQGMMLMEPKALLSNVRSLKGEVQNMVRNPHNTVI